MANDEDDLPEVAKILPPEVAKKIPWWGYLLMMLIGSGTLGSTGYIGSVLGAAQAAEDNAKKIASLEQTITSREQASSDLVQRVDTMTKTLKAQNNQLLRLTLLIAQTNQIDVNTLIPPTSEGP